MRHDRRKRLFVAPEYPKVIWVRLTEAQFCELRNFSNVSDVPMTDLVRLAIGAFLDYEAAATHELARQRLNSG